MSQSFCIMHQVVSKSRCMQPIQLLNVKFRRYRCKHGCTLNKLYLSSIHANGIQRLFASEAGTDVGLQRRGTWKASM